MVPVRCAAVQNQLRIQGCLWIDMLFNLIDGVAFQGSKKWSELILCDMLSIDANHSTMHGQPPLPQGFDRIPSWLNPD